MAREDEILSGVRAAMEHLKRIRLSRRDAPEVYDCIQEAYLELDAIIRLYAPSAESTCVRCDGNGVLPDGEYCPHCDAWQAWATDDLTG